MNKNFTVQTNLNSGRTENVTIRTNFIPDEEKTSPSELKA